MVEDFEYAALTRKIIGCAMEVHSILGNGFQEIIYQRALQLEMEEQGLGFQRELEMIVHYKNRQVGTRRVDFLVDECVIVEIKACIHLEAVHLAQAINYLEAFNLKVGLLINFGNTRLEFRRLENRKWFEQDQHRIG